MRLSELLGLEVVDQEGNVLGEVHDVRLTEVPEGGLVIDGFVLGIGSIGARLGYTYGEVEGPWVLARLLRRVSRHARYVRWQHVTSFEGNRLVAAASAEALVHPVRQRRSGP